MQALSKAFGYTNHFCIWDTVYNPTLHIKENSCWNYWNKKEVLAIYDPPTIADKIFHLQLLPQTTKLSHFCITNNFSLFAEGLLTSSAENPALCGTKRVMFDELVDRKSKSFFPSSAASAYFTSIWQGIRRDINLKMHL